MKKLLLVASAAVLLTGCSIIGGKSAQTSSSHATGLSTTSQEPASQIVIDRAATGLNADGDAVYPTAETKFQAGGKAFTATNGVGVCIKKYNEGGYYDLACLQFNKADDSSKGRLRGAITNDSALSGITRIECVWYATYETEGTQYFPVVKQGTAAGSLAAVAADQTAELTGEATGKTHKNGDKTYSIYKYTTTYTVSGSFFSLEGPSGGAGYVASFTLK